MDKHSNKKHSNKQQQHVSKGYLERQVKQMYNVDNEFGYDLGPSQPLDKKSSSHSDKKYSQSQATRNMNKR